MAIGERTPVPRPGQGVDPITLEVVRHSMVAIMDEAEANLARTAFSKIIYEVKDYCVGLVTAEGEMIAQSRGSIPSFLADLGSPVRDAITIHGSDIHEGDAIMTNYAGVCGQHLNNVVLLTPIFHGLRLIAFSVVRAHWMDVGGAPGTGTTDIYQEGVQYRCVKIYKRGVLDGDLERIVRYNTRLPDATFGDLEAQLAACELAKTRFRRLVERYGWERVEASIHASWEQSERYVRGRIRALPNGRYDAEGFLDDDGVTEDPVPIRASVIIEDEVVTVDLTEMAPEVAGPLNSGATGGGETAAKVAFKGILAPELPANEGEFRPLRVVTRPGTMVSASPEAAMGWWSSPLKTLIDVILRAFAQAIPDRVAAGHHAQYGVVQLRGFDPATGARWVAGDLMLGGWGGRSLEDGPSAMKTLTHGDTRNVPVEVEEATSPVLITRLELWRDSAGAGRYRGGLGTVKEMVVTRAAQATFVFERTKYPAWGLFGGSTGVPGHVEVLQPGTAEPVVLTKATRYALRPGARLVVTAGGGGGYGSPLERDLELVGRDLHLGYISGRAAERDYGVVSRADGEVDVPASKRCRADLRGAVTPPQGR